ncbi:hypothetical protein RSW49_23065, partial [Escherichia coli]|uniref:hypothetical protein n=2 Tax=Enterobacterales TaxID=91347 RepID=UPI0028DE7E0F
MGFSEKFVTLKLTAAIVVDGAIVTAGNLVEMVESEAKDLLRRGKAVLHGEPIDDAPADDADASAAAAQAAAEA